LVIYAYGTCHEGWPMPPATTLSFHLFRVAVPECRRVFLRSDENIHSFSQPDALFSSVGSE